MRKNRAHIILIVLLLLFVVTVFVACDSTQEFTVKVVGGNFVDNAGTVLTFKKDFVTTIKTTPQYGKKFDGWFDGDTFVSKKNPYTFVVEKDITLTAKFSLQGEVWLKIDGQNGYIGNANIKQKVFKQGETATATCVEPKGKQFDCWMQDGVRVSEDKTYSFEILSNTTLEPIFINLYTVKIENGRFYDSQADKTSDSRSFKRGDKIKIVGNVMNAYKAVKWTNSALKTVATTKDFDLTVEGDNTYTLELKKLNSVTVSDIFYGTKYFDDGETAKIDIARESNTTIKSITGVSDDDPNVEFVYNNNDKSSLDNLQSIIIKNLSGDWNIHIVMLRNVTINIVNADGLGAQETRITPKNKTFTLSINTQKLYAKYTNITSVYTFAGWKKNNQSNFISTDKNYAFAPTESATYTAVFNNSKSVDKLIYGQNAVVNLSISTQNTYPYKGFSVASDTYSFIVPGLEAKYNFVPQDVDYLSGFDKNSNKFNYAFICGYISPSNGILNNSVIFVVDMSSSALEDADDSPETINGKLVKEIFLQKADGQPFVSKVNGIAVNDTNIFIAEGQSLHRLSLDRVLGATSTSFASFEQSIKVPVNADYCSLSDGILWVGETYDGKKGNIDTSDSDGANNTWTVGFDVNNNGGSAYDPVSGFKLSALPTASNKFAFATPDYVLANYRADIRGLAFAGEKIVATVSSDRSQSKVLVYKNAVYGANKQNSTSTKVINGASVPCWNLGATLKQIDAPSLLFGVTSEKVENNNYSLRIVTASAANKYLNNTDGIGNSVKPCSFVLVCNI